MRAVCLKRQNDRNNKSAKKWDENWGINGTSGNVNEGGWCHETRGYKGVSLVFPGPPCMVEVLKPSCRITAITMSMRALPTDTKNNSPSRSAFCNGLAREAANRLFDSFGSIPLYALTAMMGVFVFLLLVDLI